MSNKFQYLPFYPIGCLVFLAFKYGVGLNRIHIFLLYLLKYLLFEPFRYLELLLFSGKIKAHKLSEAPIFVLGYWRSGTSHLQNLLRQDERFTSATIYSSLFSDHYFLTEIWLKPVIQAFCNLFGAKYSIQRTKMDLNIPGELDTALCTHCSLNSYTWGHLFPKQFHQYLESKVLFDKERPSKWLNDYDFLIRKLSVRSKGKQVVVKSPGDTGRVKHLLAKYPRAKFIYIHRDPIGVFNSNQYLWQVILKQNALQTLSKKEIDNNIIESYRKILKGSASSKSLIPNEQLAEIDFQDLMLDPKSILDEVYRQLNLGTVPKDSLDRFIEQSKSYQKPDYAPDPELTKRLKVEWKELNCFER